MDESQIKNGQQTVERSDAGRVCTRVARSPVPDGLEYGKYKEYLRYDFYNQCAYCTMTEAEAQAIRFTIDHYEPQKARPELVNDYSNLMWACDECNLRKGDRCPPTAARQQGLRFFRPDADEFDDHFEQDGIRLRSKSATGEFSILCVDLNRQTLRRLREIRQRLTKCERYVAAGVTALRSFPIDRLPNHIKSQASQAIRTAIQVQGGMADEIDNLLRDYARSPFLDSGSEEASIAKDRRARLPRRW